MKKILFVILTLSMTAFCGRAPVRWGGIVDNGHKPPPTRPPQNSADATEPSLLPTQLFSNKYAVLLPRNFTLATKTASKEEFVRASESLVFESTESLCEQSSPFRNQHGVDLYACNANKVHFIGENLEIIQLTHSLTAPGLKIIVDSFRIGAP